MYTGFSLRPPLAHGRARNDDLSRRCHPLQPQIYWRFTPCPFRESVAIWFSFLVERTNSQLTERTKKMNSENIKKITNQAIEQLITALNEGRSETLTQYLAAIGRFHRYSLRNVMLIASQKPTATHVAGFHAWHKLGRFVKKGEKGIMILAPVVRRKNESIKQDESDESSTACRQRRRPVRRRPPVSSRR